jgi:hypothetical protein
MGAGLRHRRLSLALLSLGASVLVSCGTEPVQPPAQTATAQPPQQPATPSPPQRPTVPRPARKPTPPPEAAGQSAQSADQAMAMVEPAGPPAAAPQASELIGLDEAAATRLLGEATERTEQSPAMIWRYKTAACQLDLYFYLDLRSGRMRTLHYVFTGDAADPAKRQKCLRDLVAARDS